MSDLTVWIEHLKPMRVAYATAFSVNPEMDAWSKLLVWADSQGLLDDLNNRRLYGYNNPDPVQGKAEYGYKALMTVEDDTRAEGEILVEDFPGGKYAVTSCRGVGNVFKTWQQLAKWSEANGYRCGKHQWLEQHITLPDRTPLEEMEFALYMPIAE